jgi:uncharacterized protein (DUF952 family)
MDPLVHICPLEDWKTAQIMGEYRALSLAAEGFIHCSRPEQIIDVANRYYAGRTDLILISISPSKLVEVLRWETSEGEIYPHLYGALNLTAVLGISTFPPDADGVFRSLPVLE